MCPHNIDVIPVFFLALVEGDPNHPHISIKKNAENITGNIAAV